MFELSVDQKIKLLTITKDLMNQGSPRSSEDSPTESNVKKMFGTLQELVRYRTDQDIPDHPFHKDAKIVLVNGPGEGPFFISDLLEAYYLKHGLSYKKFIVGKSSRYPRILKKIEGFKGFVIIQTNLIVEPGEWKVWQRIQVTE